MQKNLVIVESPAKAKTIEKFLGKDYKVLSSYGHIRDLKKKEFSINTDTFEPDYEIPAEKKKLVSELKQEAKNAETVWLASDEDREGEAISWHLYEVLGLNPEHTKRIVFHEITKNAILNAIKHPRTIDINLVNAQQARRVLDRIVGFKLSPVLWRKVKPALSAGRVQSVAVRLIVEREREIQAFKSEPYYRVTAVFATANPDGTTTEVKAELDTRFKAHAEVEAFLERCKGATFRVSSVAKKPLRRTPAPPFTTSTLQQEAARKLGFTVAQTMRVAQMLYESGRITYMRTDSVNLSTLCINASREEITKLYGEKYSKPRQYHTHSKGAQEAHEAIRPTYMDAATIEGTAQEKRLYDLIWKRTAASQMADAEIEKTTATITLCDAEGNEAEGTPRFTATGEVVTFDGFIKVYRESSDDDEQPSDEAANQLPPMAVGQRLERREVTATERFSQGPVRYTEASLVHKLEELGIGRPSTYAPTISTIQQREYVHKGDHKGEERQYTVDTLKDGAITQATRTEMAGSDKGKQPRRIVAAGGNVYISTFDGYIAAIDTTDYTMNACYAAGSYPEGMAVANGKLYVANSDLGQNKNPSISEIDLATGNVTDHKDALITNPVSIATVGSAMYVLDSGWYDDNWAQHDAGIRKIENGTIEKLADATFMAADARNGLVYYINSAYGAEGATVTYYVYDTRTGETRQFITGDGVDSPAAIAVDPVNGDVYISSYRISPDTGYADYAADGYVNRYRADGTFVASYDAGVGPTALAFNYHMTYE